MLYAFDDEIYKLKPIYIDKYGNEYNLLVELTIDYLKRGHIPKGHVMCKNIGMKGIETMPFEMFINSN